MADRTCQWGEIDVGKTRCETNVMFEHRRISCVSVVFMIYLLYLLVFTLSPFTFSFDSSRSLPGLLLQRFDFHFAFWRMPLWDVFSNILLFVPFGFLFVSLPGVGFCRLKTKLFLTGFSACLASFSLEMAQVFLPRFPSLVDVFLNIVGGITGGLISIVFYPSISRAVFQWWLKLQTSSMLPYLLVVYCMVLLGVNSVPFHLGHEFSNWDHSFPLQLGNEATLDRPWLGKIFLLALYDRALSQQEIQVNWTAGPVPGSEKKRVGDGVVVFYDFSEGSGAVVYDRSSWSTPLNLQIRDMDRIKWLRPKGIELFSNTIISSLRPADKLFDRIPRQRSSLSLEAWISPARLDQNGPARIVSYSVDPKARNFTLGQAKRNIVSRIRTPTSGLNGTKRQLETHDDLLTTAIQHVVITYRDGLETLYVNGQAHSTISFNDKTYLLKTVKAFFGWKYMRIYWFVVLSLLGTLAYLLIARHRGYSRKTVFLSCIVGVIVLAAMEWIPTMTLGKEFYFRFIVLGSSIVLLSVLCTAILNRAVQSV